MGIADDFVIFGECKWQNRKVTMKVLNDLIEKSNKIKASNKKYILFSKSGFSEELIEVAKNRDNVILVEGLK